MSYLVPAASFTKETWLEQFRLGVRKSLVLVWTCRHHDKQPPTLSHSQTCSALPEAEAPQRIVFNVLHGR